MKLGIIGIAVAVALAGCTPSQVVNRIDLGEKNMTSLELMALQTREYQASTEAAFGAVVGAIQDSGFTISLADKSSGLVVAKTPSQAAQRYGNQTVSYQTANVTVRDKGQNNVAIRVNFIKHVEAASMHGRAEKEAAVTSPASYQEFFAKVQKALFINSNL